MRGLLWFDDTNRPLIERMAPAMERYRERLGGEPGAVVLRPCDAEGQLCVLPILEDARMLKGHFLIVDGRSLQ